MNLLDYIDWEIIALLNEDGRMPSIEIERWLGKMPGEHHTQSYLPH